MRGCRDHQPVKPRPGPWGRPGVLGFWTALREAFPDTREQRCWWHKLGNVLAALPAPAHPGAKAALAEICNAEDKDLDVRWRSTTPLPPSTGPTGPARRRTVIPA